MEINQRAAIIPCAGQAKRMGEVNLPKSLIEIKGKPVLLHLLERLSDLFDIFYIPINISHKKLYLNFIPEILLQRIKLIESEPGSGDGQAVLDALNALDPKKVMNEVMVCWGDTFLKEGNLVNSLLDLKFDEPLLIPVYLTKDPYVSYLENDLGVPKRVAFTRRGEIYEEGKTDISLFFIKADVTKDNLIQLKKSKILKDDLSSQNLELNFLDIIEHLYLQDNPAKIIEIDFNDDVYSFNTLEELDNISNTIK